MLAHIASFWVRFLVNRPPLAEVFESLSCEEGGNGFEQRGGCGVRLMYPKFDVHMYVWGKDHTGRRYRKTEREVHKEVVYRWWRLQS